MYSYDAGAQQLLDCLPTASALTTQKSLGKPHAFQMNFPYKRRLGPVVMVLSKHAFTRGKVSAGMAARCKGCSSGSIQTKSNIQRHCCENKSRYHAYLGTVQFQEQERTGLGYANSTGHFDKRKQHFIILLERLYR